MDNIKKEHRSLKERGLHNNTFFEAHFHDGSTRREHDTNWSDMSELVEVTKDGKPYSVYAATVPIHTLVITHNELSIKLPVPEGTRPYQAIVAISLFSSSQENTIVGRVAGLIKDGEVIEEQVINTNTGMIEGRRF